MLLKAIKYLILLSVFISLSVESQNIFVLEKPGRIRNFKFYANDYIKIRTILTDTTIKGQISRVTDSSLIINLTNEIMVSDISKIYTDRWGYKLLQGVFLTSGLIYLSISTINGVINSDHPVVPKETLIISGSLVAAGILLSPLTKRVHKIDNKNWRVIILDFTN